MLYALAVYATVKALNDNNSGKNKAASREHRLAVVHTILSALDRREGAQRRCCQENDRLEPLG